MKQYKQVIQVMEENDGYATLGYLYNHVNVNDWKSKTPFASIRRIVQDRRFFFRIRPGLWALNSQRDEVLKKLLLYKKDKEGEDLFNHTYYQGLVTEIGNFKGYDTYVPNQDKNRLFLQKPLKQIATMKELYKFTFNEVLDRARTVDTIWFNERKFPYAFFEVEHTGNFHNSLTKYFDLQDFYSKFYIVSPAIMKTRFDQVIHRNIYKAISGRVKFRDYNYISNLHSKTFEYYKIERETIL